MTTAPAAFAGARTPAALLLGISAGLAAAAQDQGQTNGYYDASGQIIRQWFQHLSSQGQDLGNLKSYTDFDFSAIAGYPAGAGAARNVPMHSHRANYSI
ncbi:MAG: hypothetical protein WA738_14155 [Candidatus Angelobacter sp.]